MLTETGYQYMPSNPYLGCVREQINDIVRAADRAGIKYLGLGSLNKVGLGLVVKQQGLGNLSGRLSSVECVLEKTRAWPNVSACLPCPLLTQAEWVNHGGSDIVAAVNPKFTRICHGNTLTAAAVRGNVIQVCGCGGAGLSSATPWRCTAEWVLTELPPCLFNMAVCHHLPQIVEGKRLEPRIFLTGATSKVRPSCR